MSSPRISLLPTFLVIGSGYLYGQNPAQPVWGFADLHTHPASHLAFGSDSNGENGLFWGKPAHDGSLDLTTSSTSANLAIDLAPCPSANVVGISLGFTHNNSAGIDFVKLMSDATIVQQIDGTSPGWVHQSQGAPNFQAPDNAQGWPTGLTVDHQVMHINSIKRVFDGGLRLMFASVTNDELISKLWNQGFNLGGNPMPTHDPSFDFNSAVTQLTYITNLVNANKNWMQIVTTPSQARAAINSNPPKLAVVLSLEMDSLSLSQIQSLVQQFGVAHVIPVHLADSSFGGTAIYSDIFNGLSNFINGSFYSPVNDPNVNFRLGAPGAHLEQVTVSSALNVSSGALDVSAVLLAGAAAFGPAAVSTAAAAVAAAAVGVQLLPTGTLGYAPVIPAAAALQTPGQINGRDLNQSQFLSLMQMGLLLDVAHMGQKSATTALTLAQQYRYPVMDSHTGIRCDVNCSTPFGSPPNAATSAGLPVNERSLLTSHVQIIKQLGGVIGLGEVPALLGTPPAPDPDPVQTWINNYSIALSLMGGKGVAIGTDADGLSPMLQQDTIATNYPITVASKFGCPAGCPPNGLPPYQLGNRTYNFQNDGIATYGLLPDFIQAASQSRPIPVPKVIDAACVQKCTDDYLTCVQNWQPGDHPAGTPSPCPANEVTCRAACPFTGGGTKPGPAPTAQITALFHSAEDTIEMWEKVENALMITSLTYSHGQAGQPFSETLTARGGAPPYTWSIQSGSSLPPGLTLNRNGTISGTGTSSGSYNFTVVVQDSSTPQPLTSSLPFSMNMSPGNACPSGQHCCSTVTAASGCLSGCIPNNMACRPLCPAGKKCCGSALSTGQCDSACISSSQSCP